MTNKLMVVGCLLSFVIGASAILPFLISSPEFGMFRGSHELGPNPQSEVSQIGISFESAYIKLGTTLVPKGVNTTEKVEIPAISGEILVNATKYLNSNDSIPDAEIDYFLIQILSEDGTIIKNMTKYVGTSYSSSFTSDQAKSFIFSRDQWFDTRTGGGGEFYYTWPTGTYVVSRQGFTSSINPKISEAMGSSQTLTMTISRIGSVTFRGNTTEVSKADAGLVEQVQLAKHDGGFVYNKPGSGATPAQSDPLKASY